MTIKRLLNIELPKNQSAFLWGARKTGKSTYLAEHFPHSIYYDLLKTDELKQALVVCLAPRKRLLTKINETVIEILPWQEFLENLWNKKYI